jgi:hypothetical protein
MKKRLSSSHTGVAGEYLVAAELSRRGYIASITLRNTKGIDILVSNQDATQSALIQVKTSKSSKKYWILNKKAENLSSGRLFYVFVNLSTDGNRHQFHIVPSKKVSQFVRRDHSKWLKSPGKNGQAHKDTAMRKFWDKKSDYLNRWDILGLD